MAVSRLALLVLVLLALASPADAAGLDGKTMSLLWALPFTGILLCIAMGPLFFPHFWEHHQGKIAAFWAFCVIVPMMLSGGAETALHAVLHTMLLDYMSFIILLFALFTVAGGIMVAGNIHGSPYSNTLLLALGAAMASIVGTTGASIIMIRPVIRANDNREHNAHVVVFFIFLVSNIGGALTPLGDPPLFVGFLRGIDFFWTLTHLWQQTLFLILLLLALFFAIDSYYYKKEGVKPFDPTPDMPVHVLGRANIVLLALIIGAILMSASWKSGIAIPFPGGVIALESLIRDVFLLIIAFVSLRITPEGIRHGNGFTWGPIIEVAKLFAAIFICVLPVVVILQAGRAGALGPLVAMAQFPDGSPNNAAIFWMSGMLSSFLDNAPTYLVFFEMFGGNAQTLMGPLALTLAAISSGAVFMGANSYIGNAPNFMVYAIAREKGVRMPSFIGYMGWSFGILLPCFVVVMLIFFR